MMFKVSKRRPTTRSRVILAQATEALLDTYVDFAVKYVQEAHALPNDELDLVRAFCKEMGLNEETAGAVARKTLIRCYLLTGNYNENDRTNLVSVLG
jgi:hypothetical protein